MVTFKDFAANPETLNKFIQKKIKAARFINIITAGNNNWYAVILFIYL